MGSEQDSGHLSVWGSLEQDCSGLHCLLNEAPEAARYGLRELKMGFEPSFDCHNAHSLGGRLGLAVGGTEDETRVLLSSPESRM